jgi:lambda family phage portal protein
MKFIRSFLRRLGYAPIAKRSFPAAATNRLTNDWRGTGISIDSLLQQDLAVLRTRARDLQEGDPIFQRYLWMFKNNVLGDSGMALKNKAIDPPRMVEKKLVNGPLDALANKIIEDHWWEWGKRENCTVAKNLTWKQVCDLALETSGTDGETLVRMVVGAEADNPYNFALQLIETDRIDTAKTQKMDNGNVVKMGVEKRPSGEIVAYWIIDADPTDNLGVYSGGHTSRRYDAKDFVHLKMLRRIGQTRGWPIAAAVMLQLKMLDGYKEAVLVGARGGACNMAFLTKTPEAGGAGYSGPNADGGGKYMDAEPGLIQELPQGMDVKVVDWNQPNGQFDPFVKACMRTAACGLGVSYPSLSSDYESVNFSSGRMARIEESEMWKALQCWFGDDFCTPIFSRWLETGLLAGALYAELAGGQRITLPASKFKKFNQPCWHGRRWPWVDPQKEVAAKILELRSGLTSRTRILAELNIDRDELDEEIRQDNEAAEAKGLRFPELEPEPEPEEPDMEKPDEEEAAPVEKA